ncbi:hypothetical protein HYU22_05055 [Candidatus Woesearchaeota archaeon]|nr:hypothetical protein [Candidatus Woesearchaeota archaeon]
MVDENLEKIYERVRKNYGSNFRYDGGDYTMQRDVGSLVISIEPPQERLGPGENTYVLLTAPLREGGTPEELIGTLNELISKRDALERKTYQGRLKDYDDGIEYVYEMPTADESKLARIVRDFNEI